MSSEREHLLAAVAANPADDLPRLVFADWLDEQDSDADAARAAFIRRQIAAFRGLAPDSDGTSAWRVRWHPGWPAAWSGAVGYERGFPATFRDAHTPYDPPPAHVAVPAFLVHPDPEARLVSALDLSDSHLDHGHLAAFWATPEAGRLTALALGNPPAGDGPRPWRGEFLALQDLGLGGTPSSGQFADLVGGDFDSLRRLSVAVEDPEPAAWRAFLARAATPRLCDLDISFRYGTPAGAEQLADTPLLRGLDTLHLSDFHNPAPADAVARLVAAPRLRHLVIEAGRWPTDALYSLLEALPAGKLKLLGIRQHAGESNGPALDAWLAALVRHPAFAALETLDLGWLPFSWRALAGLFNVAADVGLKRLTVSPDYDSATMFARFVRDARAPRRLEAFGVRVIGQPGPELRAALAGHAGRYSPDLTERWLTRRRLVARTFGEWSVG